jgi:hypothetical protein
VNEQVFVLPDVSVAVHITVVTPNGNSDPDAGDTFVEARPQLSVNTGAEKFTTALLWLTGTFVTMFAEQVMLGACVSFTAIVKLQFVPFAEVHVTRLVPFGKNEPDAGEQLTAPQFPLVLGKKLTTAPHWFGAVETTMLVEQLRTHGPETETQGENAEVLPLVSVAVAVKLA